MKIFFNKIIPNNYKLVQKNKDIDDKYLDNMVKDIEENYNHSLYLEIFERNKDNLDNEALFYRNRGITYRELFSFVEDYVKSFQSLGIGAGYEIPVCSSNIPEFVILLLAASYVGARVNIFGASFSKKTQKEIINKCDSKYIFISDDVYENIQDVVEESNVEWTIMFSLQDSLLFANKNFFENLYQLYKCNNARILNKNGFVSLGKNEELKEPIKSDLDSLFTTTYSDKRGLKDIRRNNLSYMMMSKSYDNDLANKANMSGLRVLANFPTYSNIDVMFSIINPLMKGSSIAMEPVYRDDFLLDSLIINEPNYVMATRSYLISAAKKIFNDENYKDIKMPYLFSIFSIGENIVENEERFINKALKKVEAGELCFRDQKKKEYINGFSDYFKAGNVELIGKLLTPISLSKFFVDSENDLISYKINSDRTIKKEKLLHHVKKNEILGMNYDKMMDLVVLSEAGEVLNDGNIGRLYVSKYYCNMKEYCDNFSNSFKEINGKVYRDCSVYAVKDNYGKVDIKAVVNEDYSLFINKCIMKVSEAVLKDTRNVLSCEVIPQKINDEYFFVAHIEFRPDRKKNIKSILMSINENIYRLLPGIVADNTLYRIHTNSSSFQVNCYGQRDIDFLKKEGITDKCRKVSFKKKFAENNKVYKKC